MLSLTLYSLLTSEQLCITVRIQYRTHCSRRVTAMIRGGTHPRHYPTKPHPHRTGQDTARPDLKTEKQLWSRSCHATERRQRRTQQTISSHIDCTTLAHCFQLITNCLLPFMLLLTVKIASFYLCSLYQILIHFILFIFLISSLYLLFWRLGDGSNKMSLCCATMTIKISRLTQQKELFAKAASWNTALMLRLHCQKDSFLLVIGWCAWETNQITLITINEAYRDVGVTFLNKKTKKNLRSFVLK